MTAEQFLPTRFILTVQPRAVVARHLRRLRAIRPDLGRKCRAEMIRVGCLPVRWRKPDGTWSRSEAEREAERLSCEFCPAAGGGCSVCR